MNEKELFGAIIALLATLPSVALLEKQFFLTKILTPLFVFVGLSIIYHY